MSFDLTGTALGLTVAQWVDEVRREYLDPHDRAELDQLNGAVTTGQSTITIRHGASGVKAQTRVELGEELLHVWGLSTGASYTVLRGHEGTTPAAHDDNAVIRVNPRWSRAVIANQLRKEVQSWPTSVYAPVFGNFAVAAGATAFDLVGLTATSVVRRVLGVTYDHLDAANESWPTLDGRYESRVDVTAFPSGHALRLPSALGAGSTVRIGLGLEHPVPAAVDMTDDLGTDYLLTRRLATAAALGVAAHLLLTDELGRTDDRAWRRGGIADDVPAGHLMQAGQGLMQERNRLLAAEAEVLANQFAMR